MMVVSKHRNLEETKRMPHYGLRKLNVGVASVLLGVTILGNNVAVDPAQAAANTTTSTESSATPTSGGNGVVSTTMSVGSGQNAAASGDNPTTGVTPTSGTETPATSGDNPTTGVTPTSGTETPATSGQNPGTVDENHINTQTQAKNNQLAKETGLTSSDNSSSNIYKGTDGNYYKVVTIYGKDYVYRPVKVYANGSKKPQDFFKGPLTEGDTRTNIVTSKEDLGNGKVRWTVV